MEVKEGSLVVIKSAAPSKDCPNAPRATLLGIVEVVTGISVLVDTRNPLYGVQSIDLEDQCTELIPLQEISRPAAEKILHVFNREAGLVSPPEQSRINFGLSEVSLSY